MVKKPSHATLPSEQATASAKQTLVSFIAEQRLRPLHTPETPSIYSFYLFILCLCVCVFTDFDDFDDAELLDATAGSLDGASFVERSIKNNIIKPFYLDFFDGLPHTPYLVERVSKEYALIESGEERKRLRRKLSIRFRALAKIFEKTKEK